MTQPTISSLQKKIKLTELELRDQKCAAQLSYKRLKKDLPLPATFGAGIGGFLIGWHLSKKNKATKINHQNSPPKKTFSFTKFVLNTVEFFKYLNLFLTENKPK